MQDMQEMQELIEEATWKVHWFADNSDFKSAKKMLIISRLLIEIAEDLEDREDREDCEEQKETDPLFLRALKKSCRERQKATEETHNPFAEDKQSTHFCSLIRLVRELQ